MDRSAKYSSEELQHLPEGGDYRLTVRDVLELPSLRGAEVLAGHGGLRHLVQSVNVMEVPDILAWVKPNELLVTTGFPLRYGEPASFSTTQISVTSSTVLHVEESRHLP